MIQILFFLSLLLLTTQIKAHPTPQPTKTTINHQDQDQQTKTLLNPREIPDSEICAPTGIPERIEILRKIYCEDPIVMGCLRATAQYKLDLTEESGYKAKLLCTTDFHLTPKEKCDAHKLRKELGIPTYKEQYGPGRVKPDFGHGSDNKEITEAKGTRFRRSFLGDRDEGEHLDGETKQGKEDESSISQKEAAGEPLGVQGEALPAGLETESHKRAQARRKSRLNVARLNCSLKGGEWCEQVKTIQIELEEAERNGN